MVSKMLKKNKIQFLLDYEKEVAGTEVGVDGVNPPIAGVTAANDFALVFIKSYEPVESVTVSFFPDIHIVKLAASEELPPIVPYPKYNLTGTDFLL